MQVIDHLFTEDQLVYLRNLPEVSAAFEKLSTQKSVYFSIPVGSDIKDSLYESFGIDLTGVNQIPFRWIRGDTAPHIDRGQNDFDNTYLVYLTDGDGQFHLGENSYPIEAGKGFSFSEGLSHSVIGTNETSRLLLGPMSEQGFVVGEGETISADGANDTIFIQETSPGVLNYQVGTSVNPDNWINIQYFPVAINNTNEDPGNNILKVLFTTNITVNSSIYFTCGSDGIQFGNISLNSDGTRPIIIVSNNLFLGFIQNGTQGGFGYNHIYVYNLEVNGGDYTLGEGAGHIGRRHFGRGATNNYIVNCKVYDGFLPGVGSGGIVGAYAARNSGSLILVGCSSSVSMGQLDGGIVGAYAANNGGTVVCKQCFTTGTIGDFAGGIFGDYAAQGAGSIARAEKCYTTGSIGGNAGGIFGRYAGDDGSATANTCYSQGNIAADGGGIYGVGAADNPGLTSTGTANATNCYSSGTVLTTGNGIFGTGKRVGGATTTNCYIANNNWSKSTANTLLTGVPSTTVGTSWVNIVDGQPYELNAIGYTPYTATIINSSSELIQTFSESIQAGNTSSQAIITDASGSDIYTILEKSGGDSDSYASITINKDTGAVSTTLGTVPGTYTLTIRSLGSYNITTFELTLLGASAATGTTEAASGTCCVSEKSLVGLPYEYINNIRTGGAILSERNVNPAVKFVDYQQYVLYKMAQSSTQH